MKKSQRIRLIAMSVSVLGGIGILVLKFYAAKVADSSALRSDALEGTVNVLAALFGLGSLIFAEKPADRDHPYGHGKIEYFAQAFEGGLIALAGCLIIFDTISRIYSPHEIQDLGQGLKLNIIAGLGNGILGAGLYWVGKKHESMIIRADGIHLLSDLATTVGMAIGLGLLLLTGWTWIDPVLAFLVAILLFKAGIHLVRESSNALLDAENPELIAKIVDHLNEIQKNPAFEQVIAVHDLKAQEFGRDKHVDIHIVVPEYMTIKEAHDLADRYALSLHEALGHDSAIHTHVDPCDDDFCQDYGLKSPPVRGQPITERLPITVASATARGKR